MMDNASFHKKQSIQQAIIDAEHMLEYLPIYSPDLNPIDHKWAQAKSKKRDSGCDTDILHEFRTNKKRSIFQFNSV